MTLRHGMQSLIFALCVIAAPGFAASSGNELLPAHPGIVAGALDNGVGYRLMHNANPPGRVSLRLYLPIGSFNETDDERGYAHLLEHLAFAGSENFAPGEVVPYFESLGLTFGRHQNAYTGVDQTVYLLELPDASADTLRDGLTFLADVLGRLQLPPDRVEQERAVVLAERRSGLGPGQRMMEQWFPRVLQGSLAAERLPIGTEEAIRDAQRDDLDAFYRRWYTTGNASVVIVGDIAPERARELLTETFADLPAGPATEPVDPGTVEYEHSFAVVATDPEAVGAQVGLMRVGPRRSPARDLVQLRDQLVESLAAFAFNRRLGARVAAGEVSFQRGGANFGDFFGAGWLAGASAFGEAEDWAQMLEELAADLQRARALGFSEREVNDAKQTMAASARQIARTEDSIPSGAFAQLILSGVHERRPLQSGAQRVALLERLLPDITPDEVSAVFRERFVPERMAATVYMVDGEHVPDEAEVLPIALEPFGLEVTEVVERERPTHIIETPPRPGAVVEESLDDETGVYSAWLANGVRVHHRYMDYRINHVGVQILLAGGPIEEDAESRGHTLAAVSTLNRLATRTLSSTDVRDLLVGRTVGIGLSVLEDGVTVGMSAPPDELAYAFQLSHLLLTEPLVEPVAFGQWKQSMLRQLEAGRHHTGARLGELLQTLRYPIDDPRWRPFVPADIERLALESVQGWLEALVRRAPITVVVVGDIERDDALELVRTYIGSLPARDRVGQNRFDALRAVHPLSGSITHHATIESVTPQAAVFVGFAGADNDALDDVRALAQAARILSTRMVRRIREEEGLVYGIGAGHRSGTVLPGFGLFSSSSPTNPDDAARVADLVEEMYAEFAETGPTDAEAAVALRQFENAFEETAQEPGYWRSRLLHLTYRHDEPVSPARTLAAYRALDAAQIHETFRRYYNADRRLRIIVTPEGVDAATPQ